MCVNTHMYTHANSKTKTVVRFRKGLDMYTCNTSELPQELTVFDRSMVQCMNRVTTACWLGMSFYTETLPESTPTVALIILWHLKMGYLTEKWAKLSYLTYDYYFTINSSSFLSTLWTPCANKICLPPQKKDDVKPDREGPRTQLGTGAHDGREKLRELGTTEVRGDLAAAFNHLKGVIEKRVPYFSQRCMEVRHNCCKLQQGFDTEKSWWWE